MLRSDRPIIDEAIDEAIDQPKTSPSRYYRFVSALKWSGGLVFVFYIISFFWAYYHPQLNTFLDRYSPSIVSTTVPLGQQPSSATSVAVTVVSPPSVASDTAAERPFDRWRLVAGNARRAFSSWLLEATLLSIGLAAVYVVARNGYILYTTRQRNIISPFQFGTDQALSPVAFALTKHLMTQLQRAGGLLSVRQVEELQTQIENPLPLFVTEGFDQSLTEKLSTLAELQFSNARLSLGNLLSIALNYLADTRVRGTIFRHSDSSHEIWIDIETRSQRTTIKCDRVILPQSTGNDYPSDQVFERIAKELAAKIILELGQSAPLASSWQSLVWFLDGLEASQQHNWWWAIDNYQRATAHEEARNNSYSIGYYHLGTTLLLQGEPQLALNHLLHAESLGPVTADSRYMVALATFAHNFDTLEYNKGDKPNEMTESLIQTLDHYLNDSIRLRPDFPEAYLLRGIIRYRFARTLERQSSHNGITKKEAISNYDTALKHFSESASIYTRIVKKEKNVTLSAARERRRKTALAQIRVSHHIGDAHRSLGSLRGKFRAAWNLRQSRKYYSRVQKGYPGNMRNLVDHTLSFCLSSDIEKGMDFARNELTTRPRVLSSADAQLYMGWLHIKETWRTMPQVLSHEPETLVESFKHIDFALYLRPRFTQRRQQTNWLDDWAKTIHARLGHSTPVFLQPNKYETLESIYHLNPTSILDFFDESLVINIKHRQSAKKSVKLRVLAIRWREHISGIQIFTQSNANFTQKYQSTTSDITISSGLYLDIVNYFRYTKQMTASITHYIDSSGSSIGISPFLLRLSLTEQMEKLWMTARAAIDNTTPQRITFGNRLYIDIFMQIAVLYCNYLAILGLYDRVESTSSDAIKRLDDWLDSWNTVNGESNYRFNNTILRYFLITLHAWKEYADLYRNTHADYTETLNRLKELQDLTTIHGHYHHPLYLFVRSEYYNKCGMYHESIKDLTEIIAINDAYETRTFNPFSFTTNVVRDNLSVKMKKYEEIPDREKLYYLERVAGQQQFEYFTNNARINAKLADATAALQDYETSCRYLYNALTWSPFPDYDLENFIILIQRLIQRDMFEQALGVVRAAQSRLGSIPYDSLRTSNIITLDVLECILLTRLRDYGSSLRKGLELLYITSNQNDAKRFTNCDDETNFIDNAIQKIETSTMGNENYSINDIAHCSQLFPRISMRFCVQAIEMTAASSFLFTRARSSYTNVPIKHLSSKRKPSIIFYYLLSYMDNDFTYQRNQQGNRQISYVQPIESQTKQVLSRSFFNIIYQLCELHNNIAYNMARLEVDLDKAIRHSKIAIDMISYIYINIIPPYDDKKKALLRDVSSRITQYYDTVAWIYFRRDSSQVVSTDGTVNRLAINSTDLYRAINTLQDPGKNPILEQAKNVPNVASHEELTFDQSLALPHYHLSRAYLALADQTWHETKHGTRADKEQEKLMRDCLHKTTHHWRTARDLDRNGRLDSNLLALSVRISDFRKKWSTPATKKDDETPRDTNTPNDAAAQAVQSQSVQ